MSILPEKSPQQEGGCVDRCCTNGAECNRMNSLGTYLIVGLGGGFVGANARFIMGRWASQKWGSSFPVGTFLINILGSFILGLFATLALRFSWNDHWRLLIAVGFVGAFTTFSTFEYETFELAAQGIWLRAGLNMKSASVLCGLVAVYAGESQSRDY